MLRARTRVSSDSFQRPRWSWPRHSQAVVALDLRSLLRSRTHDGQIRGRHSQAQRTIHAVSSCSQYLGDRYDAILLLEDRRGPPPPRFPCPSLFRHPRRSPRPCPAIAAPSLRLTPLPISLPLSPLPTCNSQLSANHFFSSLIFSSHQFPQSTPSHIHTFTTTSIYAHTTPTNLSFPTRTPLFSSTRSPRLDSDISSPRLRRPRPWTLAYSAVLSGPTCLEHGASMLALCSPFPLGRRSSLRLDFPASTQISRASDSAALGPGHSHVPLYFPVPHASSMERSRSHSTHIAICVYTYSICVYTSRIRVYTKTPFVYTQSPGCIQKTSFVYTHMSCVYTRIELRIHKSFLVYTQQHHKCMLPTLHLYARFWVVGVAGPIGRLTGILTHTILSSYVRACTALIK